MLMDAWTIVDNAYAIHSLINRASQKAKAALPEAVANFAEMAPTICKLRNGMDHLAEKLPNIADRKGRGSALFGTLSCAWVYRIQAGKAPSMVGFVLPAGMAHKRIEKRPGVAPDGEIPFIPYVEFALDAFNKTLNLTTLVQKVINLWDDLNTRFFHAYTMAAIQSSLETGTSLGTYFDSNPLDLTYFSIVPADEAKIVGGIDCATEPKQAEPGCNQ